MSRPAVGQRVRLEGVTAPVWVQVPLGDVTGVVVADPFEHAHGQLVAVKLDPLPAVYGKLREMGMVSEEDEVVLVFPSELQEFPQSDAEGTDRTENTSLRSGGTGGTG